MDTTYHNGVTYTRTSELRFVEKEGQRRLQQRWEGPTTEHPAEPEKGLDGYTMIQSVWIDVPLFTVP